MTLTPHQAKYFAHDLTRRASHGMDRLSMALFDAAVDLNPHQIEAALFALQSPLSQGVILADEVGLGKTIEAAIVLCQFWAERRRRLLVLCPASLRKQWANELEEKFNLPTQVLDAKTWRDARRKGRSPLAEKSVVILSLNFASKLREEIQGVAWDLVVIDEAHKLRNAYRPNSKVSHGIRWAGGYRILIDQSREDIVARLNELKASILQGEMRPWEFNGLKAIWFGQHLYQPLLHLDSTAIEASPAPLNRGEMTFIEDLKAFHDANKPYFESRQLYLLRNLSKGRGIGFFEAGNFHPDFILWLLDGPRQRVVFIDPKGIRNLGPTDPKIQFHRTIKDIERRLGDPTVSLSSYIVSNTPSATMRLLWNLTKAEMNRRHILFQDEDQHTYVQTLLRGEGDT